MNFEHEQGRTLLELKNVGFCYSRRSGLFKKDIFWALKDVSFDVYRGETLGVLGRNGAGKSTLLRILAGIFVPDRGTVKSNGCRASLLSLQVGFVPHLTGRENAILSGMLLGVRRKAIEEKITAIQEFADLGDFFDQPVRNYSSGMRARLGFAVTFQADPDIVLVDEVMGVGDAEFRIKSTAAMKEKIKSDKTVIMVSHTPQTLLELCDRIVWIEGGKTVLEGEPQRVLDEYRRAVAAKRQ